MCPSRAHTQLHQVLELVREPLVSWPARSGLGRGLKGAGDGRVRFPLDTHLGAVQEILVPKWSWSRYVTGLRYHGVMDRYRAQQWGDHWVVLRREDQQVVSRRDLSHEDAVLLSERLNVAIGDMARDLEAFLGRRA